MQGLSTPGGGRALSPQVKDTELVYSGITGGTYYTQPGGRTHYLCMPKNPDYSPTLTYRGGVNEHNSVYGSEYQGPLQGTSHHNVPCAVCPASSRSKVCTYL